MITLFLILSSTIGCVQSINVTSDGVAIPTNVVKLQNPETGIKITTMLVRVYTHKEGNESLLLPEYLPIDKKNLITARNTKQLQLLITVYNPNKRSYQMWEHIEVTEDGQQYPVSINRCFYNGNLSINQYVTNLPLSIPISKVIAIIYVKKDGRSLIEIGPVNYEMVCY